MSQERLETLKQELSSLREEFAGMKAQWDNEKKSVDHLSKLREEIEQVHQQIAQAQQKYDLNKAAELQYGKLPQLEKQLAAEEESVSQRIFLLFMRLLQMMKSVKLFQNGQVFLLPDLQRVSARRHFIWLMSFIRESLVRMRLLRK